MARLTKAERDALPASAFGDPKAREFPIHDAAHVRAAEARLEQARGAGRVRGQRYERIRARVAAAALRLGVESEYNRAGSGRRAAPAGGVDAASWAAEVRRLAGET